MPFSTAHLEEKTRISYDEIEEILKNEIKKIENMKLHKSKPQFKIKNVKQIFKKLKKILRKVHQYVSNDPTKIFNIKDFDAIDYERFIFQAYNKILNRIPDDEGLDRNISRLLNGWRKTDILFLILHSEEALYKKIAIKNFYFHFFTNQLFKIPIFGRLIESLFTFIRLPSIINRLEYKVESLDIQNNNKKYLFKKISTEIDELKSTLGINSDLMAGNLQNLYLDFENTHRGSQNEIKKRQAFYLSFIKKIKLKKNYPILDVGCGRGEWISLLKDNKFEAIGIDTNAEMISSSLYSNIDLRLAEANDFLLNQENEKFMAITAFHVVEHMFFNDLFVFLKRSYSKIVPGGLIILETPNPENITVGSCHFYMDPTHKKPIPPNLLKFLLEAVGFNETKIVHPYKKSALKSNNPNFDDFYNEKLAVSPDYAIIGYK